MLELTPSYMKAIRSMHEVVIKLVLMRKFPAMVGYGANVPGSCRVRVVLIAPRKVG